MPTKTLILSNLAIAVVGGIGSEAVASPKPTPVAPLTFSNQTGDRNDRLLAIPQWLDREGNIFEKAPRWLEKRKTDAWATSQWSDFSSSPSPSFPTTPDPSVVFTISTFPEAFPVLAGSSGDVIAQNYLPSLPQSAESSENDSPRTSETESPLTRISPMQPTAEHLGQGEFVFNFRNRVYFLPEYVENGLLEADTGAYPNLGFSWGITDNTELTFEYQRVDSASPARQGDFIAILDADEELSLDLKQQFWENSSGTLALSGVLSLSWGNRDFIFSSRQDGRLVERRDSEDLVVGLQFPFTATIDDRLRFTISPTLAFFPEENAMFYSRLPIDDPGSFGTTFGFTGAVSYRFGSRIILWGDAFIPVAGNNSISRESGKPDQAMAYNVGLRYLVNPRIGLDVFASNAQGSVGPLSLTADRDLMALGAAIVFMPDFIGANRRYADSFGQSNPEADTRITTDGFGFFDGGTLPSGKFLFNLQGGSQGILTSLRYGLLKDLEVGVYLDYVFGEVDESEQGFSGKVRLLNQADGAPFTASLAGTYGLTNQPFANFRANDRNEFDNLGLSKEVPLIFQGDSDAKSQLYLITLSLPLHYEFDGGAAVWLTPVWGYAQRLGTEIAGFSLGGSIPLASDLSLIGEIGANFVNPGNAFLDDERKNVIPWSVGIRWDPSALLGLKPNENGNSPKLEVYLTNRVGSSTWHQLRGRDQDELGVGVGLSIPFSF
ncbi:hypothetical protein NIES593_14090 [Hydrococcus rivularis NIES-593]|uniref:Uncharacterized protein n=1 Tax=Hydrococcus rivularis NIES-593 TaxID=1921803 RepID=A0A1U7HER6_9CYAN|nr:hypothetical protein [Hydrococcus rivularis]OKH22059.1 hypothetical protein NIES593_14090 [Hydrococcus rivularis NIES-593]